MKKTVCEICDKPIKINSRMCSHHSNDYGNLKRSTKVRTEKEMIEIMQEKYRGKQNV